MIQRVAMISMHASPLALFGERDAGGMNVYVRDLALHLARLGVNIDIFVRRTDPQMPEIQDLAANVRVIQINAGPGCSIEKARLPEFVPDFADGIRAFALAEALSYDLIHAHYWLSGWAGSLIAKAWSCPLVMMFHTTA